MYNVSLKNLLENQTERLEWKSSDAHRELCTLKGKLESDCQNYIRVFARIDDHKIMVCGTNSYKPLCRYYKNGIGTPLSASAITNENEATEPETVLLATNDSVSVAVTSSTVPSVDDVIVSVDVERNEDSSTDVFEYLSEIDGQGRCPYNPTHNSSYIFTGKIIFEILRLTTVGSKRSKNANFKKKLTNFLADGQLYSGTAADFSGGDALIYRENQRTEQFNAKQLNQPSFISTVERNGYVFFFFREIALENCGKTIYSRVARVCKNDRGGLPPFHERWTSYLKTRLNCSIPGDFPFYFDELRA